MVDMLTNDSSTSHEVEVSAIGHQWVKFFIYTLTKKFWKIWPIISQFIFLIYYSINQNVETQKGVLQSMESHIA